MFFFTNFSLFFQSSRFLLASAFPYAVIIIVIITMSLILITAIDCVHSSGNDSSDVVIVVAKIFGTLLSFFILSCCALIFRATPVFSGHG